MFGVSLGAVQAQTDIEPQLPPEPPTFEAQQEPNFVGIGDILEYGSLDEYHEPEWVSKFVDSGDLPPVEERLPDEPMIYKASNMPDGIGNYGGVLRHVIGGRPEGWNYIGGQSQGWGGIDIGMYECLTRTGPLFMVRAEELAPMPNLARSWEWSEDGTELTMNLIEGAKWSDGDPFDAEDVMFYWEDHVLDPNVSPLNGATQESFGAGTTLEQVDDYTVKWTFEEPFSTQYLYQMAYGTFCPGPSHILKPEHPEYSDNTYEEYKNAFPPDYMHFPVMGAWVPVEYRSDDIIVLRRNPYYWKVDSEGNQLPYLDELYYRLSTWADRDVQAVAGSGDFSNLEQAESYVEALRRSAEDDAPARLQFGPRTIGYTLQMNMSANGWGDPDARAQAVRELNREVDFRKAITMAIDRQRLGESLVRGPFTAIYPGGLYPGTTYYDRESTAYFPHNLDAANALLDGLGLEDTDGNGIRNFPEGTAGGQDVEITVLGNTDYNTDRNLVEGVIAMLGEVGIRGVANLQQGTARDDMYQSGQFDWQVLRQTSEIVTVVQNTQMLAPTGPRVHQFHRAGPDGELDLLPFEQELVDIVESFVATNDLEERAQLMKDYQRIYTENVYAVGLTVYPGALIINKRFANIPAGAPIFMYNWAEDNIIRERVYVPEGDQLAEEELFPETLPGAPGADSPLS